MSDLQTAQPASDTSAGGQTASAPSKNLDDALSRVYDESMKPASEPAKDIEVASPTRKESFQVETPAEPDKQPDTTDEPEYKAPR